MESLVQAHTKSIIVKRLGLFLILLCLVLAVNASVISFNLMYPEQPSIYLANQTITHFSDLVSIYLHPKLLHNNIPFFRPSGHFLMYQLITPIVGWHNTKAFLIINFIFLAAIGYILIQFYQLLFPPYRLGGYLAFSLYLMHPALSISRLTIMHFDFAYVCLLLYSLYLFAIFCQKNKGNLGELNQGQFKSSYIFFLSLLVYVLAMTFKEPAIMLGPVLLSYYCIYFYNHQRLTTYAYEMVTHRQTRRVLLLITIVSACLGLYLWSSWPTTQYVLKRLNIVLSINAINAFVKDVLGLNSDLIHAGKLAYPYSAWRTIVFPPLARVIMWVFVALTILSMGLIWVRRSINRFAYQKSLVFLSISSVLFLILPFCWAVGGPWHYSPALIFMCLIMGFGFEYIGRLMPIKFYILCASGILINLIAAVDVNNVNIKKYDFTQDGALGININRNAISNPPNIKSQLTPNSMIVVEDSILHNDYMMGNAAYPYLLFLGEGDYDYIHQKQEPFFLKFHHTYSGSFFRYAYLMPSLKEELYPFQVERMSEVPNEIIYNWLKHYDDIFCLGYDLNGEWQDKTKIFKQQLNKERGVRALQISAYSQHAITTINAQERAYMKSLTYPDSQLCEFTCDQDRACRGFVYQEYTRDQHRVMLCHYYYHAASTSSSESCENCTWFEKAKTLS